MVTLLVPFISSKAQISPSKPVFLNKLDEVVVSDRLCTVSIIVLDTPLVFPIRPDKCDLV
jgi:hypothetical protein